MFRLHKMLMESFPKDSEEANSQAIFMQDGTPAHTCPGLGDASKLMEECLSIFLYKPNKTSGFAL